MNAGERDELARLLPFQGEPELPEGRHRQIKEFVMTEIHQNDRPAKPKWRLSRPAVLAPVLASATIMAIAVPLAFGGGAQAYAVTKTDDGLISITINEAKKPKDLQADLRAMGLNAVVDYVPMGKECSPQPRSQDFVSDEEAPLAVPPRNGQDFTIDPKVVKAGQTAVLEFSVYEGPDMTIAQGSAHVSNGPVADCVLVDSTEAPAENG
ncbi:hypothetical protein AB0B89_12675 [Sphaerisporangium sp. NPDC049002]|uniref:hypothetical protein n=1 Tax=unclassified Sphaerisporangium TaxID=2630420 RepID=UPI0033E38284